MKIKTIVGTVLISLILASAFCALGGIWGKIDPEKASKLIATFFVIGLATFTASYASSKFLE